MLCTQRRSELKKAEVEIVDIISQGRGLLFPGEVIFPQKNEEKEEREDKSEGLRGSEDAVWDSCLATNRGWIRARVVAVGRVTDSGYLIPRVVSVGGVC